MLHDVTLLNRTIDIVPALRIHSHPLTLPPLLGVPPRRQDPLPPLRQIQERPERRPRILARVYADVVAPIGIFVLDTHAETVDQLREGLSLGELVQIVVLAEAEEGVDGVEARIVRVNARGPGAVG